MTPEQLASRAQRRPVLLDGALGTLFMTMGLKSGEAPERWVFDHPDRICEAHRRYVDAGSDIVHTVTFGATPAKLSESGITQSCEQVNAQAVALARKVCGSALVAGDVGPTGRFLPPTGDATEEQLEENYGAQMRALANAGVDLISIETMYDMREAMVALRAAKATKLATLCSMTFEARKRGTFTFMGNALAPTLLTLFDSGATAVGCNCSVSSEVMVDIIKEARAAVPEALIVAQPNAGQPITTIEGVRYKATPEGFADDAMKMVSAGARILGGCCGTDERFVRAIRARIDAMSEA